MQPCIKKFFLADEYYIDEGCYITEISNSEDDPCVSIARARVELGVTTRLHQLLGTIERYVILQGEGLVEVGDLSPQVVKTSDVVLIPSECPQKITNTGSSDLIFLVICTPRFEKSCYQELSSH